MYMCVSVYHYIHFVTLSQFVVMFLATERYDWGINDDATGICTEIPLDPAGFLENCNYDKHCKKSPIK